MEWWFGRWKSSETIVLISCAAYRPEHGGNCDIKNLSRGSKVFLPVHVKGAKFSVGDLHFSRELSPTSTYNLVPDLGK